MKEVRQLCPAVFDLSGFLTGNTFSPRDLISPLLGLINAVFILPSVRLMHL